MTGVTSLNPTLTPYLPTSYTDGQGNLTVPLSVATQVAQEIQQHVQNLPPSEASLYMSLLNSSPDIAPSGGQPPADLDATLGRLDNAVMQIQQAGGDVSSFLALATDVNALAALLIKQAQNDSDDQLNQRIQARTQAKTDLQNQAGQQEKAASDLQSSAVTSLVLSCVSAAMTLASAAGSIGGGVKGLKGISSIGKVSDEGMGLPKVEEPDVGETSDEEGVGLPKVDDEPGVEEPSEDTEVETNTTSQKEQASEAKQELSDVQRSQALKKVDYDVQRWSGASQGFSALATAFQGASGYVNSSGQAQSQTDQAVGSLDAAQAQEDQSHADMGQTVQQQLDNLVQSLITSLNQIQESKAQAMQSMTRV